MESHWPGLPHPGQESRWILGESAEGSKFRNLSGNCNWNFMTFFGEQLLTTYCMPGIVWELGTYALRIRTNSPPSVQPEGHVNE